MGVEGFLRDREYGGLNRANFRHRKNDVRNWLEKLAADPVINKPCEFSGEPKATFLVDFSPDRTKIASCHGDHTVRVSNISNGKCTHILTGHPRTPWCVAFHPSRNDILASGCLGGQVRIWDLRGGGSEVYTSRSKSLIASLTFHPIDNVVVFATKNKLYFWDWTRPEPFTCRSTCLEQETVRWVKFDMFGNYLYTGIYNDISATNHTRTNSSERSSSRLSSYEPSTSSRDDPTLPQRLANRERYMNLLSARFPPPAGQEPRHIIHIQGRREQPPSPVHEDRLRQALDYARLVTTHSQEDEGWEQLQADHSSLASTSRDSGRPHQPPHRSVVTRRSFLTNSPPPRPPRPPRDSDNEDEDIDPNVRFWLTGRNSAERSERPATMRLVRRIGVPPLPGVILPAIRERSRARRMARRTNPPPPEMGTAVWIPGRTLREGLGSSSAAPTTSTSTASSHQVNPASTSTTSVAQELVIPPVTCTSTVSGHEATTSTSMDPASTSMDPASTSMDPASTSRHSALTSMVPVLTSMDPASTSMDPASTSMDPASTSMYSASTSRHPALTSRDPVLTSRNPAVTSRTNRAVVHSVRQRMRLLFEDGDSNSQQDIHVDSPPNIHGSRWVDMPSSGHSNAGASSLQPLPVPGIRCVLPETSCRHVSEGGHAGTMPSSSARAASGVSSVTTASHSLTVGIPASSTTTSGPTSLLPTPSVIPVISSQSSLTRSIFCSASSAQTLRSSSNSSPSFSSAFQSVERSDAAFSVARSCDGKGHSSRSLSCSEHASDNRHVMSSDKRHVSSVNGAAGAASDASGTTNTTTSMSKQSSAATPSSSMASTSSGAGSSHTTAAKRGTKRRYISVFGLPSEIGSSTSTDAMPPPDLSSSEDTTAGSSSESDRASLDPNRSSSFSFTGAMSELTRPHDRETPRPRSRQQLANERRRERIVQTYLSNTRRERARLRFRQRIDRRSSPPPPPPHNWRRGSRERPPSSDYNAGSYSCTYIYRFQQSLHDQPPGIQRAIKVDAQRARRMCYSSTHWNCDFNETSEQFIHCPVCNSTSATLAMRMMRIRRGERQRMNLVRSSISSNAYLNRWQLEALRNDINFYRETTSDGTSQTDGGLNEPEHADIGTDMVDMSRVDMVSTQDEESLTPLPLMDHMESDLERQLFENDDEITRIETDYRENMRRLTEDRNRILSTLMDRGSEYPDPSLPRTSHQPNGDLPHTDVGIGNAEPVGDEPADDSRLPVSQRDVFSPSDLPAADASSPTDFSTVDISSATHLSTVATSSARDLSTVNTSNGSDLPIVNTSHASSLSTGNSSSERDPPTTAASSRSELPSVNASSESDLPTVDTCNESDPQTVISSGSGVPSLSRTSESSVLSQGERSQPPTTVASQNPQEMGAFHTLPPSAGDSDSVEVITESGDNETISFRELARRIADRDGVMVVGSYRHVPASSASSVGHSSREQRPGLLLRNCTGNRSAVTAPRPPPSSHTRAPSSLLQLAASFDSPPRPVPPPDDFPASSASSSSSASATHSTNSVPPPRILIQRPSVEDQAEDNAADSEADEELMEHWVPGRNSLHPHYARSVLDHAVFGPSLSMQSSINSAIAGVFMSSGEQAVASNIVPGTFRIQQWDFRHSKIPDISKAAGGNVVVEHCKIHNDASIDLSHDATMLATFVHIHGGFPDENVLGVFSLRKESFGQCLYTKSFGPNAISVSISPSCQHVIVGLASRRMLFIQLADQIVGQIFKLVKMGAGEDSMLRITDVYHPVSRPLGVLGPLGRGVSPVSVNSARWLPDVGEGIVYGTNHGDLHFFRSGRTSATVAAEEAKPRKCTTSTQTGSGTIRRSACTQTADQD